MNAPSARPLIACAREVGAECPYCAREVALGDPIMTCSACGTVHHKTCWRPHERCGSYACAPGRRDAIPGNTPVLALSMDEIARAEPLPARRPAPPPGGGSTFVPRAESRPAARGPGRLAIVALGTALAGLPILVLSLLTGIAVIPLLASFGGLGATILGSVALGRIGDTRRRGLFVAITGVLLGLADMIGGLLMVGWTLERSADGGLRFVEAPPDPAALEALSPELRRAMRANVLIERRQGLGTAVGSGVIVATQANEALIVTNRHVVDPSFTSDETPIDVTKLGLLDITTIGQQTVAGRVTWVAPGGVDLALVRVPCSANGSAVAASWEQGRAARIGESVFAIGNPQRLGWTHTQGVISQFRAQDLGGRRVKLIQTQAAINPGNSGGGLYDSEGYLLGVNTWTSDKRIGEGISFAIALDSLLEFSPPGLAPHAAGREPDETPAQP